ncbi:5'/3'-nucleotidase SurE [Flavobacterium branchiophilum]|uniref:5'-nucleotidase SurE n=1 Tax=Flavobacterium branchiophilum TaxID=55197 RepID=A0A543G0C3_9FLAO|nr:5'/3'-nucleotidase SurE [Flavobacterium branchiophilum]OXA77008.1 5'/3'-nucleotidase SurE [Flavobacterium branchiophilum] [Flavobacterium branchiophilum NBRC 15030 = ATCC 35035]TQM39530.1 5'-nucleotidase /3'-nucleotidase /exopolyphosphatase [Flavobacterium branchiophilum]GEM54057.1 5'-nucleotidase SurE [Flavobacterium branchiophilum NBRC 15030 = ATCC 35035]
MKDRPLILVTNDDGISAKGIQTLVAVMSEIGDVVVVAPDKPQSAMGHAITINNMLYLNKFEHSTPDIIQYSCSGTPVDCVKIAISEILPKKPDLCVSGINHGSNSSINIIYSGTMSAAVEAGIEGIPAIGFSFLDYSWDANFEETQPFVKQIAQEVLKNKLPEGVVLNVNLPNLKANEIKGIKICRQAKAVWEEKFDKRKSPFGKDYYWLSGQFVNHDKGEDTDEWALAHGYISIVPVQFDMTAHFAIQRLNEFDF